MTVSGNSQTNVVKSSKHSVKIICYELEKVEILRLKKRVILSENFKKKSLLLLGGDVMQQKDLEKGRGRGERDSSSRVFHSCDGMLHADNKSIRFS